jgi:Ni/Co efflux regulator RcnB
MKRLMTAALALSLLGGTAAMAQPYGQDNHDNRGGYDQGRGNNNDRGNGNGNAYGHDRGNGYAYGHDQRQHRWNRGERLPTAYYQDRGRYIDYRRHNLRHPPRGYQWVQVDNNYALVALSSGLIAQLIAGR